MYNLPSAYLLGWFLGRIHLWLWRAVKLWLGSRGRLSVCTHNLEFKINT